MIRPIANILIVDDEPLVLDMFKTTLELEDYQVFVAENGFDATKILKNYGIDVFICDVILPDTDGFHLLNYAKSLDEDIQVMLVTAAPNPIDKARAIAMGAHYFSKPLVLNELKSTIKNSLQHLNIPIAV